MINEFLSNLEKSLRSETVPPAYIESILNSYRNIINEAIKNNKSEEEILRDLGNPVLLATELRQKLDVRPNTLSQDEIQKIQEGPKPTRIKRGTGVLFLSMLGKILINIITIPLSFLGFLAIVLLFVAPPAIIGSGVTLILYKAYYVNGYEFIFSTISSLGLGIGLIGLGILIFVGLAYVLVGYLKMITLMFSHLSSIMRRYK